MNRYATQKLFSLLYNVHRHSDKNLMTATNLAIVFGPNLLRDPNDNPTVRELLEKINKKQIITKIFSYIVILSNYRYMKCVVYVMYRRM